MDLLIFKDSKQTCVCYLIQHFSPMFDYLHYRENIESVLKGYYRLKKSWLITLFLCYTWSYLKIPSSFCLSLLFCRFKKHNSQFNHLLGIFFVGLLKVIWPNLLKIDPTGSGCLVKLSFEHLQEQRCHNLSGQLVPTFYHLSEKNLSWYSSKLPSLQLSAASYPHISWHLCEEYNTVFSISTH